MKLTNQVGAKCFELIPKYLSGFAVPIAGTKVLFGILVIFLYAAMRFRLSTGGIIVSLLT